MMRFWLLLFVIAARASAENYYVDYSTGSDSENGTSTSTPWKHCPGATNATSTANSTSLAAGDIVHFKGGVSYNTPLKLNFNGSSGNPIIYDGNYDGNWGTGKAIIDRTNDYSNVYGVYTEANRSYVTIRNFEIRNVGGYASTDPVLTNDCTMPINSPRTGIGISFHPYTCSGITIHDLWVHHCGQWRNQPPFSNAYGVEGGGIRIGNGSQIVISNCTVSFTKAGIGLYPGVSLDNVTITKCDIGTNLVWGIDVATEAAGVTFSNINIVRTKIHDYHIYDLGNWLGCNTSTVPHTDGIFVRTAAYTGTTWTNVNISACEFYSDLWGNSGGGTASIFVSQGPSVNIFNNTFIGDIQTRCIGVGFSNPAGTSPQVVRIYNNTFVTDSWPALISSGETDPAKRKIYFNNNLIVMNGDSQSANWTMIVIEDVDLAELNHNLYYSTVFTVSQKYVAYMRGFYRTFADVQGFGFETNGLYANPQLVDVSYALNGSSSANNVRLLAASPARNMGESFGEYFLADKDGQPKPPGQWDIGAYEYFGSVMNANVAVIGRIQ